MFLHVANVGDCRAVLCRGGEAVVITTDHTPSVPSEAARVEAAGGFVSRGRVNGILGVSRSFGDIHCKVRVARGFSFASSFVPCLPLSPPELLQLLPLFSAQMFAVAPLPRSPFPVQRSLPPLK